MEKKYAFTSSLVYFIIVCCFITLRILSYFNVFAFMGEGGVYFINAFFQIGILFIFPILVSKLVSKSKTKDVFYSFGYERISFKVILVSFAIGVLVYVLNTFISSFFFTILTRLGYEYTFVESSSSVLSLVLNLIFVAVLPAICEENAHRGMLMLGNKQLGVNGNIILTGLMFGLLHLNIEQFFYATLIGMFLCYIAYASGSIFPCMIIHFVNNALSVIFSFCVQRGLSAGGLMHAINVVMAKNIVFGTIVLFVVLAFSILLMKYLVRKLQVYSFEDNYKTSQKFLRDMQAKVNLYHDIYNIKTGNTKDLDAPDSYGMFNMSLEEFREFVKNNPDAVKEVVKDETPKKSKMEMRTAVLLWASIVLSGVATIFTFVFGASFIWGVI